MVKVALVGTHGIGKTTLAFELAGVLKRRGNSVELLTEIARECPLPLNEEATREAYLWIISRQIQLEIEKSLRAEILICDRSVLDNYAYYARRYGRSDTQAQALGAFCYSWMKTYDLLVRLPIMHPLTADGFRSTDEDFQREIDGLCDELFEPEDSLDHTRPRYRRGAFSATDIAHLILHA